MSGDPAGINPAAGQPDVWGQRPGSTGPPRHHLGLRLRRDSEKKKRERCRGQPGCCPSTLRQRRFLRRAPRRNWPRISWIHSIHLRSVVDDQCRPTTTGPGIRLASPSRIRRCNRPLLPQYEQENARWRRTKDGNSDSCGGPVQTYGH